MFHTTGYIIYGVMTYVLRPSISNLPGPPVPFPGGAEHLPGLCPAGGSEDCSRALQELPTKFSPSTSSFTSTFEAVVAVLPVPSPRGPFSRGPEHLPDAGPARGSEECSRALQELPTKFSP